MFSLIILILAGFCCPSRISCSSGEKDIHTNVLEFVPLVLLMLFSKTVFILEFLLHYFLEVLYEIKGLGNPPQLNVLPKIVLLSQMEEA